MAAPLLLIDMDGTLLDSLHDLAGSVNHALTAMGRPPRSLDEVRSFVGHGASTLVRRSLAGGAPEEIDRALEYFFAHYAEHCLDTTRLFPGWEAVLAAGRRLVCATNKPERFARVILDGLGLTGRFELLVGGDTLPVKKPDPAVSAYVAARLGVGERDFVMVGDGPADGELARNAGFPFWAVRWGYAKPGELEPLASAWLERPEDILERLV